MRITIWNENSCGEEAKKVRKAYPNGMSNAIAEAMDSDDHITISSRNEKEQGLSQELLDKTDVLIYWAHCFHDSIEDATVERIAKRVSEGMGIILLHSAHFSKIFKKLTNATGSLIWREDGKHERLYNVNPTHPIASGLPSQVFLEHEEMYGEPFDIGEFDDIVFVGWFAGGEIFRSGFTSHYGKGKIFYFQPGHETFPTYYNKSIKLILNNAKNWVAGKEVKIKPYAANTKCSHAAPKEKGIKWFIKKGEK